MTNGIAKRKTSNGVLITFSVRTEKFKNSERTLFFKKLYGWRQTVPKDGKTYTYERHGLLDEIPSQRVDQSSFIVPEDAFDDVMDFFEGWRNKIILKTFKVILEENNFFKEFNEMKKKFYEQRKRMMEKFVEEV